MPPRPVSKPNWSLVLTCASMTITLLTLLGTFVWTASQKTTNLDSLTAIVTNNTAETKNNTAVIQQMQIDIQHLKDQNQQLIEQVSEMRATLASPRK